MKTKLLFLVVLMILVGCTSVQPRRPINPRTSTILTTRLAAQTKVINAKEDEKIAQVIAKDSLSKYEISADGFYYKYITKKDEKSLQPTFGDEVQFEYSISDLNDLVIYSAEELGVKTYKIDQEDFIYALQKGLKLMKVGETVQFIIPAYSAFGITGDGNKIGINQSIKSTLTLINIKQTTK